MKNTWIGLLLFTMAFVVACSSGGEDVPEPAPNPEPKPEPTPSITFASTADTKPVFSQEGGEVTISFTATEDWTASVTNTRADNWISVSPTNGGEGEATITITTTANDTYDERNATVTLKCGTATESVVISQKQLDALTVTSNKCEVGADGGTISVKVKANVNFNVEVKADWIKEVKSRGLTSTTLEFSVDKNETDDNREGEIIISSGALSETVKVYQGFHNYITLTQREFDVPSTGGNIDIEIKSTVDYEVEMLSGADWITEDMSRATSTHTHHYVVAPNETYDIREAQIVFVDKGNAALADTVTIRQAYMGAILIADSEYEMNIGGGELDFKVQANVNIEVAVDVDWIKQVESRGLTEHALFFNVEENQDNKGREGTITIKETDGNLTQTIKVKQKGLDDIPYLTFAADAYQTLTMSQAVATLEYSVNGGEWKELGTNTVTFGGDYGTLRFRGICVLGTGYSTILFGTDAKVTCSGDIRTLTNYWGYETMPSDLVSYNGLFKDCTCLIVAPELPATTLGYQCYMNMFSGCTGLTKAPKLPATTLTDGCYASMFSGCTSLTEAPALSATTLAEYCYSGMFSGCTELTSIPELPATTLAEECYSGMFSGCTGLTSIPKLPATTLAKGCYSNMFGGCIGLTSIPELPVTTLAESCYSSMFSSCTGLTSIFELPATVLAEGCYSSMFYNCTSLTSAPVLPATTLAEGCYSAMFSSCTGLISTPELPATTLAEGCYSRMFYNCTSLIKAPELPATTLAKYCYSNMFLECTNLISPPEILPASILTEGCYSAMFWGCTNLSSAPEIPATMLESYSCANMFVSCSNLTEAPELPATILADNCYSNMFSECINLVSAPKVLPATTLAEGCYFAMFGNCTSLTKAPELPATILAKNCYYSMFSGCSSLTETPILSASTLTESCYNNMFRGCRTLNKVTMLATDINAENCLYHWMLGVASKGAFVKASTMIDLPEGENGIPKGWTVNDFDLSEEDQNIHMGGWKNEEEL